MSCREGDLSIYRPIEDRIGWFFSLFCNVQGTVSEGSLSSQRLVTLLFAIFVSLEGESKARCQFRGITYNKSMLH